MPDAHASFNLAMLKEGFFDDAPTKPALTGTISEQTSKPIVLTGDGHDPVDTGVLPDWVPFNAFPRQHELVKPPLLVDGLIHQSTKTVVGGSVKRNKTWGVIDMAISVSEGTPFWGRETTKGLVLYIDFELMPVFGQDRIWSVHKGKGFTEPNANLIYWNLRGVCYHGPSILSVTEERLNQLPQPPRLIVCDPIYKLAADIDENSSGAVTQLMLMLEQFSERTKAAIVFTHHLNKAGSQPGNGGPSELKLSGSNSYSRDPDTILVMSEHPEDSRCSIVEGIMRNLPAPDPFVVEFDWPVFKIRDDLEARPRGRRPQNDENKAGKEDVLALLQDAGSMHQRDWQKAAEGLGLTIRQFETIVGQLRSTSRVYLARDEKGEAIWKPEEDQ